MIESGREYRCENAGCTTKGEWLGKKITLQVDHLNGNWLDDRIENVRFLCPNCHSQTEGFCGSKGFAELTSRARATRVYRARVIDGPVAELAYAGDLGSSAPSGREGSTPSGATLVAE